MIIDITEKDWGRIVAAVQFVEAYRKEPGRNAQRGFPALPNRNALITTTFTARSGTTKGQGVVTLYNDDGTGSGNMVVLKSGVTCWTPYGGTPPVAGKWGFVAIVDGLYQIVNWEC